MKKQESNKERVNVYQMVTNRVIEQLSKGVIPWRKPWVGSDKYAAINYVSRKPYSMLNQMLLGRAGEWLTFKQIQDAGGRIKKGARSEMVVFYTTFKMKKRKEVNEEGEEITVTEFKEHDIPVLRYYNVFHITDCEGIESRMEQQEELPNVEPIERAEDVINGYLLREKKLTFRNDEPSGRAFFNSAKDLVVVPMIGQYDVVEEYYSTTFHELTHSTGMPYRCNRKGAQGIAAFGSKEYSREELVAELGSAMLCQLCELDCEKVFNNSVAYIQSWLKALKNDNKMIVWASSRAEKAARYIYGE